MNNDKNLPKNMTEYKKDMMVSFNSLLLDVVGRDPFGKFKDYKKEMESMTMKDVFGKKDDDGSTKSRR